MSYNNYFRPEVSGQDATQKAGKGSVSSEDDLGQDLLGKAAETEVVN